MESLKQRRIKRCFIELEDLHKCKSTYKHSTIKVLTGNNYYEYLQMHCSKCCSIGMCEEIPENFKFPKKTDDGYCCSKKCMILSKILADGIACDVCEHFGQCYCRCISFLKYSIETHNHIDCTNCVVFGKHNCDEEGDLFYIRK